jgi:hypothetical protein
MQMVSKQGSYCYNFLNFLVLNLDASLIIFIFIFLCTRKLKKVNKKGENIFYFMLREILLHIHGSEIFTYLRKINELDYRLKSN